MGVPKIDPSEIPEGFSMGRPLSEETVAIRALLPGEAIRFPCRWKHSRICHGYSSAVTAANRAGFSIKCKCVDRVVYVMRRAE